MKTSFFCISLLLLVSNLSFSQNYESFFGVNETHIVRLGNENNFGGTPLFIDSLAITSEVMTQSNQILKKADRYIYFNSAEPINTLYFREDLVEGKLWQRESIEGDEVLVVDLSMELNDVINSIFTSLTVSDVMVEDNQKYIEFSPPVSYYMEVSNQNQENVFFREGIITFFNDTYYEQNTGLSYVSICVYNDGEQVFSIGDEWDINFNEFQVNWLTCELLDVYNLSNENFERNQLKVYPNPVSNQLYVESQVSAIEHLQIFDVSGKNVMEVIYQENQLIDVSTLTKGLYFVKIETVDGSSFTKKLVKD